MLRLLTLFLLISSVDARVLHGSGHGGSGATPNSVTAATNTANQNALCTAISPFYWEVGKSTGAMASGAVGAAILPTKLIAIASASKWPYGAYVVGLRGAVGSLTATDINFLHMTSGYTNIQDDGTGSACPSTLSPRTIDACLAQTNSTNGQLFSWQNPTDTGVFSYSGGHFENHAGSAIGVTSLGGDTNAALKNDISAKAGSGVSWTYSQPLLAGGIATTTNTYTQFLRNILSNSIPMYGALGANAVCTSPGANYSGVGGPNPCPATASPIPATDASGHAENWHYSMAHWVEDAPAVNGDGAFSSPGAFGFYPWIDSTKTYYGVVARVKTGLNSGYKSAACGRLIRRAFITGNQQTNAIPDP